MTTITYGVFSETFANLCPHVFMHDASRPHIVLRYTDNKVTKIISRHRTRASALATRRRWMAKETARNIGTR